MSENEYLIRFVDVRWDRYPFTLYQELETIIPERTDGRVKFELATMEKGRFTHEAALTAVRDGAFEMAIAGNYYPWISPVYKALLTIPFISDDVAHLRRLLETDELKAEQARLEAWGIKEVAITYMGQTFFWNNVRPLERVGDFKGLKFRTPPVPGMGDLLEAMGAHTVPIEMQEVVASRSEERRVGKECRSRWSPYH